MRRGRIGRSLSGLRRVLGPWAMFIRPDGPGCVLGVQAKPTPRTLLSSRHSREPHPACDASPSSGGDTHRRDAVVRAGFAYAGGRVWGWPAHLHTLAFQAHRDGQAGDVFGMWTLSTQSRFRASRRLRADRTASPVDTVFGEVLERGLCPAFVGTR